MDFISNQKFKDSIVLSSHLMFLLCYYPRKVRDFLKQLDGDKLENAIDNIFQSFRTDAKKFIYFNYNENNNLESEHKTFDEETKRTIYQKNYEKMCKCFANIQVIYSLDIIKNKAAQIGRDLDYEISSIEHLIGTVENKNNKINVKPESR